MEMEGLLSLSLFTPGLLNRPRKSEKGVKMPSVAMGLACAD